jgi:8-oxo-dGTP pyrophosphatase MutT (NUDIX family)
LGGASDLRGKWTPRRRIGKDSDMDWANGALAVNSRFTVDDSWYVRREGLRHRRGAGGVVVRLEGREILVALVKEVEVGDHHYVVPKGGIDDGEDIDTAARREIAEESGLIALDRLGHLGTLARLNAHKTYWQSSHYGLFRTEQTHGTATDPDNYGLAWFSIGGLPPMCWPDEERLIVRNRARIERALDEAKGR